MRVVSSGLGKERRQKDVRESEREIWGGLSSLSSQLKMSSAPLALVALYHKPCAQP